MTEQQARRHANQPSEEAVISTLSSKWCHHQHDHGLPDIFVWWTTPTKALTPWQGQWRFAPKVDTPQFHFSEPATVTISAEAGLLEFETKPDPSMNGFSRVD